MWRNYTKYIHGFLWLLAAKELLHSFIVPRRRVELICNCFSVGRECCCARPLVLQFAKNGGPDVLGANAASSVLGSRIFICSTAVPDLYFMGADRIGKKIWRCLNGGGGGGKKQWKNGKICPDYTWLFSLRFYCFVRIRTVKIFRLYFCRYTLIKYV